MDSFSDFNELEKGLVSHQHEVNSTLTHWLRLAPGSVRCRCRDVGRAVEVDFVQHSKVERSIEMTYPFTSIDLQRVVLNIDLVIADSAASELPSALPEEEGGSEEDLDILLEVLADNWRLEPESLAQIIGAGWTTSDRQDASFQFDEDGDVVRNGSWIERPGVAMRVGGDRVSVEFEPTPSTPQIEIVELIRDQEFEANLRLAFKRQREASVPTLPSEAAGRG